MVHEKQGLVFISCGQYRPEEIKLGDDLTAAVNELTPFEGYFAQNVTSLDGLSRNIFSALNRCCGFVGVMHHRGEVATPDGKRVRGSVWVEQEIAIAAFLSQAQERDIQVVVYTQRGISREGVRDQLHLNPIEFDSNDEALADFKARLRDGRFSPVRLLQSKEVDLRFQFKTLSHSSGLHRYSFTMLVMNTGTQALTDYWCELRFPKAAIDDNRIYGKVGENETHIIILLDRNMFGRDLYPEEHHDLISVSYHMDVSLFRDGSILTQPIIGRFGSSTPRDRLAPYRKKGSEVLPLGLKKDRFRGLWARCP
jgi:hypothetical protein